MELLDQGKGREKILVYKADSDEEDATPEEVILSIQGYLVKARMPPITRDTECVLLSPAQICH